MPALAWTRKFYDDAGNLLRTFTVPYNFLTASAVPGVADDDSKGYNVGSLLVRKGTDAYLCYDNTTGAAKWANLTAGGGGSPTGAAGGDLAGTYPNPSVAKSSTAFALTGILAVTLSASQNDYNPTGLSTASVLRIGHNTVDITITGLAGGSDGRILVVENANGPAFPHGITFTHNDAASAAGNRFFLPSNIGLTIAVGGSAVLQYSSALSAWTVLAASSKTITETELVLANVTTDNVTSTAHGFAPKSPGVANNFLNGAATPAYAQVQDSDLLFNNVTTGDVSTSAHGFAPILPNDATKFLNGIGTYTVPTGSTPNVYATETASQSGFAAETNLAGGQVTIPAGGIKAGTIFRCRFQVAKTAAGIVAASIRTYVGTNGNNTDAAFATLTFAAQTAVADDGIFEIWMHFRSKSTTGTISGVGECRHRLTTTGLVNNGACVTTTGNWTVNDNAIGGQKITVTVNAGTSASWTISSVESELLNLP